MYDQQSYHQLFLDKPNFLRLLAEQMICSSFFRYWHQKHNLHCVLCNYETRMTLKLSPRVCIWNEKATRFFYSSKFSANLLLHTISYGTIYNFLLIINIKNSKVIRWKQEIKLLRTIFISGSSKLEDNP